MKYLLIAFAFIFGCSTKPKLKKVVTDKGRYSIVDIQTGDTIRRIEANTKFNKITITHMWIRKDFNWSETGTHIYNKEGKEIIWFQGRWYIEYEPIDSVMAKAVYYD